MSTDDLYGHPISRRTFAKGLTLAGVAAATAGVMVSATSSVRAQGSASTTHRHDQIEPFPVNAFIVEGQDGLVVVDATLTDSSSTALRNKVDEIGKPLQAILLTHPHPDHYAGLGNLSAGLDVPIVSVAGVNDIAQRDDAEKDERISRMFPSEWPTNRVFPNHIVADGDSLDFGPGLRFTVRDIGPAESFHDSIFIHDDTAPAAFVGDLVYTLMHAYMVDNHIPEWKRALSMLQQELPEDMILHVGHGAPVTPAFLAWQETYLDKFEAAILNTDWGDTDAAAAAVVEDMKTFLPSEELLFFLQQSVLPNARRLGRVE